MSQLTAFEMAESAYKYEKYYVAIPLYKKLSNSSSIDKRIQVNVQIGMCYQKINDFEEAARWFQRALDIGADQPNVYLKLGNAYLSNEQFNEAIEQFQTYARITKDSTALNNTLRTQEWLNKIAYFEVYNESGLNTKYQDFSAHPFYQDIIFTSNRKPIKNNNFFEYNGKAYIDLYRVKRIKNKWEKPEELKTLNTPFNDGVSSFCENTSMLYYTQCNGNNGNRKTCRIYQAEYDGIKFTKEKPIEIELDSVINFGNPCISKDGKVLYYTSDMQGGFGENDIYVSYLNLGKWSTPKNLGNIVNTSEDDDFPFIHPDGTLYFSSKGHEGMGGFDQFYTKFDSFAQAYTIPVNLRHPTNSTADDFGIVLNEAKDEGYFASNRVGGKGEEDIYTIFVRPPVVVLQGRTFNTINNKVLRETNLGFKTSDDKPIAVVTDKLGFYSIKLEVEKVYQINAQKNGYFGDNAIINTESIKISDTVYQDFYLTPFPKIIVLKGIYYDLNSADLREESFPILDSLLVTLQENPNLVVELSSHTDARADNDYNLDLSQRRAQSVVNYLVAKGIDSQRLVPKGYGETRLVNKCADGVECTEEEHQENRRTEFSVLRENFDKN